MGLQIRLISLLGDQTLRLFENHAPEQVTPDTIGHALGGCVNQVLEL
jgi:hypothetical protein